MSLSFDSWIRKEESSKRAYEAVNTQKQDALLLKTKTKTLWPLKTYTRNAKTIRERQIHTSVDKKYRSKPHITKIPSYRYQPFDLQLTKRTYHHHPPQVTTAPVYHDSVFHDMADYVENALGTQQEENDQHENKVDLIKDLSIELLDQLLHQIMNTEQDNKVLDWKFIMSHLVCLKALPVPILDRIQRHMELKTGKTLPCVDQLNTVQPPLSDLTLSNTECEMKEWIQSVNQEKPLYESTPEDQVFVQDIQWLLSLTSQDNDTQQQTVNKIQTDYTDSILKNTCF